MARHMSNAHRIQQMAAEAAATQREKAEKKAATAAAGGEKKKRASRAKAPKAPARLKIVWAVGEPGGTSPKIFPYAEKAAAEAEAARLGKGSVVKALKVPME
jgi:hypothetical protein